MGRHGNTCLSHRGVRTGPGHVVDYRLRGWNCNRPPRAPFRGGPGGRRRGVVLLQGVDEGIHRNVKGRAQVHV